MDYVVLEAVRKYKQLDEDIKEFNELKDNAFKIFQGYSVSEENIKASYGYWEEIAKWHSDSIHEHKHLYGPEIQDLQTIGIVFEQLRSRSINKKEFLEKLTESRNAVIQYSKEMEEEKRQIFDVIKKTYDDFFDSDEFAKTYTFIFKATKIKNIIIKFILS